MSYYYPSHYPQISPRDNYFAALARAKAAEQEYLASEAIELEARQIRRRLEELQFQRQRASQPFHGTPDRLSLLRLQLQEEERRHAEAELFRRRNFQDPSAAFQFNQDRPERAQLARFQQRHQSTNHTSTGEPLAYTRIPAFRPRYGAMPSRHIRPAVAYPPHALPDHNSSSSNVGFQELLHALSGRQPSSSATHHGPHVCTPMKAERKPVVQPVDTAALIEQTLKAILSRADLEFYDQSKTAPVSAPRSAPAPSCSKRNPPSRAPVVQDSTSSPLPSADTAVDLQQVLKHIFAPAVRAYTSSEGRQAVPPSQKQLPSSPITSLKERLEARLASEETTEVKDTIQATFNSLSDATIPMPSSSTAEASPSLSKGKAKAESAPSTDTASEDLAVSLARVHSIESAYRSLIDDFSFPSHLDFITPSSSPATEQSLITRLAYTARNAPVRFHEQSLSGLLSQLDSVESFGDEGLRAKRKEVVGLVEGALEGLEREVEGRWRARIAKGNAAGNTEEPTPLEVDSAHVDSLPAIGPAPASALASDPTSNDRQTASSPISASPEQPEVVAPLDVEMPSIEAAQVEEDVSSDETSSVSTDTESSADSFDDVEADTFRSASTITDSSTIKVDHDGQSTLQVNEQGKGEVSDDGSDWSEVEA